MLRCVRTDHLILSILLAEFPPQSAGTHLPHLIPNAFPPENPLGHLTSHDLIQPMPVVLEIRRKKCLARSVCCVLRARRMGEGGRDDAASWSLFLLKSMQVFWGLNVAFPVRNGVKIEGENEAGRWWWWCGPVVMPLRPTCSSPWLPNPCPPISQILVVVIGYRFPHLGSSLF